MRTSPAAFVLALLGCKTPTVGEPTAGTTATPAELESGDRAVPETGATTSPYADRPTEPWGGRKGTPVPDDYGAAGLGQVPHDVERGYDPSTEGSSHDEILAVSEHGSPMATVEIETAMVEPDMQRSIVVGFHRRVSEAKHDDELGGLLECLGRTKTTEGGSVDIRYRTRANGNVDDARAEGCSFAEDMVCSCMTQVVGTWKLGGPGVVEVSILIRARAGQPSVDDSDQPRDGRLW